MHIVQLVQPVILRYQVHGRMLWSWDNLIYVAQFDVTFADVSTSYWLVRWLNRKSAFFVAWYAVYPLICLSFHVCWCDVHKRGILQKPMVSVYNPIVWMIFQIWLCWIWVVCFAFKAFVIRMQIWFVCFFSDMLCTMYAAIMNWYGGMCKRSSVCCTLMSSYFDRSLWYASAENNAWCVVADVELSNKRRSCILWDCF